MERSPLRILIPSNLLILSRGASAHSVTSALWLLRVRFRHVVQFAVKLSVVMDLPEWVTGSSGGMDNSRSEKKAKCQSGPVEHVRYARAVVIGSCGRFAGNGGCGDESL